MGVGKKLEKKNTLIVSLVNLSWWPGECVQTNRQTNEKNNNNNIKFTP